MFGALKEKISQYLDGNLKLVQLSAVEKGSKVLGFVSYGVIILFVCMLILVFLGMSLAELYSWLLSSHAWGYLLTAGTFVIFMVVLVACKKYILSSMINLFVNVLTEDADEIVEEEIPTNTTASTSSI